MNAVTITPLSLAAILVCGWVTLAAAQTSDVTPEMAPSAPIDQSCFAAPDPSNTRACAERGEPIATGAPVPLTPLRGRAKPTAAAPGGARPLGAPAPGPTNPTAPLPPPG